MATLNLVRALLLILFLSGLCYSKEWRGIIPLHSTRKDVERLIGPPKVPNGIEHDFPNELVIIFYSRGPCVKGWPYGWDVQSGVVTSIRRVPKTRLGLSEIDVDVAGYEQNRESDTPGWITYVNQREGLSVTFNGIEGTVQGINYMPPANEQHLSCPGANTLERDVGKTMRFKTASSYDVSFEDEKVDLDNFARALKRAPGWEGYIVAYAGRHASAGEAQQRAKRAKTYVVRVRRVNSRRIFTIDGGYRDNSQLELFLIPPQGPKPVPLPTVDPRDVRLTSRQAT